MYWEVYAWWEPKAQSYNGEVFYTYDGKGSTAKVRTFSDRPSAERYTQEVVELRGAHYAKMERIGR